jgi:hypothetical protein
MGQKCHQSQDGITVHVVVYYEVTVGSEMPAQGAQDGYAVFWLQIEEKTKTGDKVESPLTQELGTRHYVTAKELRIGHFLPGDLQLPRAGVHTQLGVYQVFENSEDSTGATREVEITRRWVRRPEAAEQVQQNLVLQLKNGQLKPICEGPVI